MKIQRTRTKPKSFASYYPNLFLFLEEKEKLLWNKNNILEMEQMVIFGADVLT